MHSERSRDDAFRARLEPPEWKQKTPASQFRHPLSRALQDLVRAHLLSRGRKNEVFPQIGFPENRLVWEVEAEYRWRCKVLPRGNHVPLQPTEEVEDSPHFETCSPKRTQQSFGLRPDCQAQSNPRQSSGQ